MRASLIRKLRPLLLGALLAAGFSGVALAGEEQTFDAFSAWTGKGFTVQSGPNEKTFVGSIGGRIYVQTDKGPVDAGEMICPITLKVNIQTAAQEAVGKCTFAGNDGALLHLDMKCTGIHLVGCNGKSVIESGTGRFAGVTGGGPFTVRTSQREITQTSTAIVDASGSGIIFWKGFKYKMP